MSEKRNESERTSFSPFCMLMFDLSARHLRQVNHLKYREELLYGSVEITSFFGRTCRQSCKRKPQRCSLSLLLFALPLLDSLLPRPVCLFVSAPSLFLSVSLILSAYPSLSQYLCRSTTRPTLTYHRLKELTFSKTEHFTFRKQRYLIIV